jgi:hypothetical protein
MKCDHKGSYRIGGGGYVVIRWCVNCGKSWRMPTQGDYLQGDHPVAEWEPIKEPRKPEVVGDYDERRTYEDDLEDSL